MPAGIVTSADARYCWAWAGVRARARGGAYAGLPEQARQATAARTERAWLAGQLWAAQRATGAETRLELRYRVDPGAPTPSCALLARARGRDETAAIAAAMALRQHLAALPAHLEATPIAAAEELDGWLNPFGDSGADVAEVRRRWQTVRSNRLGPGQHAATMPLPAAGPAAPAAWAPLWETLARHSRPVVLTVGLAPLQVPVSVPASLCALGERYERLAAHGAAVETGVWSAPATGPPDPAGLALARLYHDAASRYEGWVFRMRISVLSPWPIPDTFAQLVAETLWPEATGTQQAVFPGPGFVVARPAPGDREAALHAVSVLDPSTWAPATAGRLLAFVAGIADAQEASLVFRLPPPVPLPVKAPAAPAAPQVAAPAGAAAAAAGAAAGEEELRRLADKIDVFGQLLADQQKTPWDAFARLQRAVRESAEARCPSVFTVVPRRERPTGTEFELRLYCEEPGGWHPLPADEGCYQTVKPAEWLRRAAPWLRTVLGVLKHATPLAGAVMGVAAPVLHERLQADLTLMTTLLDELSVPAGNWQSELGGGNADPSRHAAVEADFRVIESLLADLDPYRRWGGLSRTTTPDGQTLFLCRDHAPR
jgi:hypothetical protein